MGRYTDHGGLGGWGSHANSMRLPRYGPALSFLPDNSWAGGSGGVFYGDKSNKGGRIGNRLAPSGRNARKGAHIVFGSCLIPTPLGGYPIRRIRRQSGDGGVVNKVGKFREDSHPRRAGIQEGR